MPATVGVVVAAYQAARHLGAALQSVLDQSHSDWLCVTVDDGSTDATAVVAGSFVARDGRFRLVRQANAGVSAARNAGLAQLPAGVELVCFLDSDDVLLPGGLEALVAAMARRPDAAGASGWAGLIDADGNPQAGGHADLQRRRPAGAGLRTRILGPDEDTSFASLLLHGSISPPATAVVRRAIARRLGGFDEALDCWEDSDFWLRAARLGPLAFVDRQIASYRRHDANATARTACCLRRRYEVRRKAWSCPDNTAAQRRAVLTSGARLRAWDLLLALRRAQRAAAARRPGAALWAAVSAAVAAAQILLVWPLVPPIRWVELCVRLDDRCGFDRSGDW